jgi:hypothetical protein
MKKAVLISALLFSYLISFSSHQTGSETTTQNLGSTISICHSYLYDETPLFFNSDIPNDTAAYLYLDPVSNTLYLSITIDNPSKIAIFVMDILGNVVWTLPEATYDPGKQLLSGALDLDYGQYIVKVLKNGSVCKTQKILVIK